MAKKISLIFLGMTGLVLSACSTAQYPEPRQSMIETNHVLTTTSGQGQTYVFRKDADFILCTNSQPDAAFDQSEGLDLTIGLVNTGSDSGGVSEGDQELELAGRSPALLMSRELFFRACEFSHNYKLTQQEAKALYEKTLDGVLAIWTIEAGNTTVNIGDTVQTTSSNLGQKSDNAGKAGTNADNTSNSESSYNDASSYNEDGY